MTGDILKTGEQKNKRQGIYFKTREHKNIRQGEGSFMSLVGLQAQHALLAVSVCVAEGGAPQAIISVDSCLAKRRPFCGL